MMQLAISILLLLGMAQVHSQPVAANDLSPITSQQWTPAHAAHLLERAGFGGTPDEIARMAAMSPQAAVNELVNFKNSDRARLNAKLAGFDESDIHDATRDIDTPVGGHGAGAFATRCCQRSLPNYVPAMDTRTCRPFDGARRLWRHTRRDCAHGRDVASSGGA